MFRHGLQCPIIHNHRPPPKILLISIHTAAVEPNTINFMHRKLLLQQQLNAPSAMKDHSVYTILYV